MQTCEIQSIILSFLDVEREESERAKQERNATIMELVHTLRDVVSASRPDSPTAAKQQEISTISDSIQSLIQSSKTTPQEATLPAGKPTAPTPARQQSNVAERLVRQAGNLSKRNSLAPSHLVRHQTLRRGSSLVPGKQELLSKARSLPVQGNTFQTMSTDRRL